MSLKRITGAATSGNAAMALEVPAGNCDIVKYGLVTLTTDGTVADRTVVLTVEDGGTALFSLSVGAVQAASVTGRVHTFFPQALRETSVVNGSLMTPIPELVLTAGQTIEITITNGVAGDSFTADFTVERN